MDFRNIHVHCTCSKATLHRLQTFINRCLRRIVGVHWPDTISNADLYERTNQVPVETEMKRRKWRWIGHTLRQPRTNLARHSLRWNPQGKRSQGRPRTTWRRELEAEMKREKKGWKDLEMLAGDRLELRVFVGGLCSTGS